MKTLLLMCILFCTSAFSCECNASSRYALLTISKPHWGRTVNYTLKHIPKKMWPTVQKAFDQWGKVTEITFNLVKSGEGENIVIQGNNFPGLIDNSLLGWTNMDSNFHVTISLNMKHYSFHVGAPFGVQWNPKNKTGDLLHGPKPASCDIDGVVLHEIGHAMGLAHSTNIVSGDKPCMCAQMSDQTHWLHADDIAGVQVIYPPTEKIDF